MHFCAEIHVGFLVAGLDGQHVGLGELGGLSQSGPSG